MRTRIAFAAVVAVLLAAAGVVVWRAQPGDAPARLDGYLLPPPDPRFPPEQGGRGLPRSASNAVRRTSSTADPNVRVYWNGPT